MKQPVGPESIERRRQFLVLVASLSYVSNPNSIESLL